MTTCAARIVPGTTQADDAEILDELRRRALFAAERGNSVVSYTTKRQYVAASLAYHAKWSGAEVHA